MRKYFVLVLIFISLLAKSQAKEARTVLDLNGIWQFDQTVNAFPPAKFTRTIPVPGLVHLAMPKIEDYDKLFKRPDIVEAKQQHSLCNIDYTYRCTLQLVSWNGFLFQVHLGYRYPHHINLEQIYFTSQKMEVVSILFILMIFELRSFRFSPITLNSISKLEGIRPCCVLISLSIS